MEMWAQTKIIAYVFNPLAKITVRFSEKMRDRIFVASGFMIFLMTFIYGSQYEPFRYLYAFAFDCLMLGIIILCSLRQDMKPIVFDKRILILAFVFGLSALVSGIFLDIDYLSHAMLCLMIYPVIYIVWNNVDVTHIFRLLLKISNLSFVFYFLVNLLFYPIEGRQYGGFTGNPNYNAFFSTLFACCFLFQLFIGLKNKRDFVFLVIGYGLNGALLYCTASRTGMLAVILSHIFSIIMLLIILKNAFWKLYGKKIIVLMLSVFLFMPITIFVFQIPRFCAEMIQQVVFHTDAGQTIESPFSSFITAFANILDAWKVKTAVGGKDVVRVSSGRIDIWKGFLSQVRFIGHAKSDTFSIVVEGVEHIRNGSAHMMILQYAYQFGILAGLCFLGINLIAGIKSILFALKYGKNEIITIFPFMISIAYGVISLLSSIGSFTVFLGLYYFLAQTPFIKERLEMKSNA